MKPQVLISGLLISSVCSIFVTCISGKESIAIHMRILMDICQTQLFLLTQQKQAEVMPLPKTPEALLNGYLIDTSCCFECIIIVLLTLCE